MEKVITKAALIGKIEDIFSTFVYNNKDYIAKLSALVYTGEVFGLLSLEEVNRYQAKASTEKEAKIVGGYYSGALCTINKLAYDDIDEAGRVYAWINGKKSYVSKRFVKVIE